MYKKILLPTDGSERSNKAISQGVALAKAMKATVVGFHAIAPYSTTSYQHSAYSDVLPPERYLDVMLRLSKDFLSVIENAAQAEGVPYESSYLESDSAAAGIIRTAKEHDCDLIFMASHGRGSFAGLLLGSVTIKVLAQSKIPVMVYR